MCDRSFAVEYNYLSCFLGRLEPDCFSTHCIVRMWNKVCPATLVHRNRLCPDYESVLSSTSTTTPRGRRDEVSREIPTREERWLQKCGSFAGFVLLLFLWRIFLTYRLIKTRDHSLNIRKIYCTCLCIILLNTQKIKCKIKVENLCNVWKPHTFWSQQNSIYV